MFESLKEMQETLSYDDLCKYADESLGKSAEEIKVILKSHDIEISDNTANECYEFLKGIDIVSDDELDNVAGGSCYSSETFDSLGIWGCEIYKQQGSFHPLITTIGNSCKLYSNFDGKGCFGCTWISKESGTATAYCKARSKEFDPCKV